MKGLRRAWVLGAARGGVGLLALLALLAAPLAPAGAVDKVRVAYIPAISFAPMFVTLEKGFVKEQNQEWEMLQLGGGSKAILPLTKDEIQVSAGSSSGGFFNTIAKGARVKVVLDKGQINKQYNYVPLSVSKELWDKGQFRTTRDLLKVKIGQFGRATISDYALWKLVEPYGVNYKDLDLSYLDPPKQYTAMKTGAIKASMTVEPWATRMELEGVGVTLPGQTDWLKDRVFQVATIMFSYEFITQRRPLAQSWVNASLKGLRYYHEKGLKHDEIVTIVSKWTKVPPDMIKRSIPPVFAADGRVDTASMQEVQRFYKEMGYIEEIIPAERYIDNSFIEQAAK
ncbi:MAG: ABC transporter substrate-binding protein [Candidatus Tectomicrobia bacterium]|nr:ABC transporter substrate-binding protein [Candidatus Tectomicrobia bacterium]